MVALFVKRYAVRKAKIWRYAVRKAKIEWYAVRKGRGCHPLRLVGWGFIFIVFFFLYIKSTNVGPFVLYFC